MTKQTIEERIASALNNGSTGSASIAELIRETEAAIEAASDTAEQERPRGRDLTCTDRSKTSRRGCPCRKLRRDQTLEIETYRRKCRETGN